MKQQVSYQQVETFDLDCIRQAFEEGRLFIAPREESAEALREKGIRTILDYVSRIDDCTSSDYRTRIRDIWSQVLHDDDVDSGKTVPFYDQVPQQFSRDQLQELTTKLGLSPARIFISKWRKAKLIHQPNPNEEIYIKNY